MKHKKTAVTALFLAAGATGYLFRKRIGYALMEGAASLLMRLEGPVESDYDDEMTGAMKATALDSIELHNSVHTGVMRAFNKDPERFAQVLADRNYSELIEMVFPDEGDDDTVPDYAQPSAN